MSLVVQAEGKKLTFEKLANLLWPRPQEARILPESVSLPAEPRISAEEVDPRATEALIQALVEDGRQASAEISPETGRGSFFRLVQEPSLPPEGYRLRCASDGVEITASTTAGFLRGISTLRQWLRLHRAEGRSLAGLQVSDQPDFAVRGVLLDISRDKVPRLETLFELVDRLSSWKINQLQLYFEHTFAYQGHEVVWKDASPLTPEDLTKLLAYCRERCIDLVPNQNSFGHLHRWLRHDAYRPLAEVPEGVKHPFGDDPEPFSLCPLDPGSLALLEDLYDQLLPHFDGDLLNVGCDETFDLGLGRSAEACEERGKGRVYLDFLQEVHGLAAARGRRIQFWGDIIIHHPELIPEIPQDAIALEWGYEANHPFAEHGSRFAESGLEFYVCPGTSSWNSFAGRTANCLGNLANAATHGRDHGASGYLITDWGDFGHLQPLPASYLGFLAGAGFAWNVGSAADPESLPLTRLLDHHAFQAPASGLGRAFFELGDAYRAAGIEPMNASTLFHLFLFIRETLENKRFDGLTVEGLETARAAIRAVQAAIPSEPPEDRQDLALARKELTWAADLLDLCARLGIARLEAGRDQPVSAIPEPLRHALAEEVPALLTRHTGIWQARNRPGGLQDSQQRLRRLGEVLSDGLV